MKVLLVTGGAGFVGSNFVSYFLSRNKNFLVVNIDKLSHTDCISNLREIEDSPRYHFIKGDICNYELVNYVLKKYKPDYLINFADEAVKNKKAESEFDRFTERPTVYAQTNIMGTLTLLEGLRYIWNRRTLRGNRFIQVSTDEVYGLTESDENNYKLEESALLPLNTYAASKAAADLMIGAFSKSYGIPAIITRCCTSYGPSQGMDKFVPMCITNALQGKPIQIAQDDYKRKEWIHVQDNSIAIIRTLFYGRPGEIYNLGTGEDASNIDIAKKILKICKKPEDILVYPPSSHENTKRLTLNSYKSRSHLNWSSKIKLDEGLKDTVSWYMSKRS